MNKEDKILFEKAMQAIGDEVSKVLTHSHREVYNALSDLYDRVSSVTEYPIYQGENTAQHIIDDVKSTIAYEMAMANENEKKYHTVTGKPIYPNNLTEDIIIKNWALETVRAACEFLDKTLLIEFAQKMINNDKEIKND